MHTTIEATLKDLSDEIVEACLSAAGLFQTGMSMSMYVVRGKPEGGQPTLIESYTLRQYLGTSGATNIDFSSYVTLQGWTNARVKIVTDKEYFFVADLDPETNQWSAQETDSKYQPLAATA